MAYEIVKTKSIVATATLAAKQYFFVKLDSNGQVVNGTAGAYCIGVVQDNPPALSPAAVCFPGDITKVSCGGSFNAGGAVMSDSAGKAVAATSGSHILGWALSAGADGFIADIIFQPSGKL